MVTRWSPRVDGATHHPGGWVTQGCATIRCDGCVPTIQYDTIRDDAIRRARRRGSAATTSTRPTAAIVVCLCGDFANSRGFGQDCSGVDHDDLFIFSLSYVAILAVAQSRNIISLALGFSDFTLLPLMKSHCHWSYQFIPVAARLTVVTHQMLEMVNFDTSSQSM